MAWWRLYRRIVRRPAAGRPAVSDEVTPQPSIREAERRRLLRLLQRRAELSYDLEQSERAWQATNRWTERLAQLNAAIEQAESDLVALKPPRPRDLPPPLPPVPVEVVGVSAGPPAQVVLRIGDASYAWREEIDWAERGHQLAPPRLVRYQGQTASLVSEGPSDASRAQLVECLGSSLDQLAEDVLAALREAKPAPSLTLADLARPCSGCGGWQDLRGRCPVCARLAWRRQQLHADVRRLRGERDATLADLQRVRDRLPVIRRQLADVESEIAALRAKGVDPG